MVLSRRQKGIRAGYAAGVMLIASGTAGSIELFALGYGLLARWFPAADRLLFAALVVLGVVAALGGFTVIAGTRLAQRGRARTGKVLIGLGAGTGLLGLALHVIVVTVEGSDPVADLIAFGSTLSGVGILLSIWARSVL